MALYIVATPIGNLEDITLRALRTLKEVKLIYAEDTRHAKRLLNAHAISTPLKSYHAHSEDIKTDEIITFLKEGNDAALITDAGTPGISDPGNDLVRKVREALPELHIYTIPGASALTAALSIAGMTSKEFTFFGFLPHKKGRQTIYKTIASMEHAGIFYESTHRILKALEEMKVVFETAQVQKKIIICRELTKIYEEVLIGSAEELLHILNTTPEKQKGEFVVIIE